jgi:hypothetical protein
LLRLEMKDGACMCMGVNSYVTRDFFLMIKA